MKRLLLVVFIALSVSACGGGGDGGQDHSGTSDSLTDVIDVDGLVQDVGDVGERDDGDSTVVEDQGVFQDVDGDLSVDLIDDVPEDGADVDDVWDDVADAVDVLVDVPGDDGVEPADVTDVFADDGVAGDGADDGADVWFDVTDDGPDVADTSDQGDIGDGLAVRIVAANITSGSYQSYPVDGAGLNILDALNPDIVLLQEFNYRDNTDSDYREFAQLVVGTDYWAADDPTFQIPNGVVSRWPITSSGYWEDPNLSNRELMWATIDIPGPVDIMAVSVHLHTSPSSDQVEAAQVIVTKVKAHKAAHPGEFMYVVGGDFNGTSSVSSSGFGGSGTFYVDGPDPADDDGNENTNANRNSHYDYVLADPTLHEFQVPVVFPSVTDASWRQYDDGLVFDTRTFTQAELNKYFPPADVDDSAASQMQHMAVVKDFLIE